MIHPCSLVSLSSNCRSLKKDHCHPKFKTECEWNSASSRGRDLGEDCAAYRVMLSVLRDHRSCGVSSCQPHQLYRRVTFYIGEALPRLVARDDRPRQTARVARAQTPSPSPLSHLPSAAEVSALPSYQLCRAADRLDYRFRGDSTVNGA